MQVMIQFNSIQTLFMINIFIGNPIKRYINEKYRVTEPYMYVKIIEYKQLSEITFVVTQTVIVFLSFIRARYSRYFRWVLSAVSFSVYGAFFYGGQFTGATRGVLWYKNT